MPYEVLVRFSVEAEDTKYFDAETCARDYVRHTIDEYTQEQTLDMGKVQGWEFVEVRLVEQTDEEDEEEE